jgi:hypothetical protein
MPNAASPPSVLVTALAAAALLPLAGCINKEAPPPVALAGITEAVAVADLDQDLVPDVVSVTSVYDESGFCPGYCAGYLSVRLQSSAYRGVFADPIRTFTCLDPKAIALGDVDGDGRLDVAVACGATAGSSFEVALHLQIAGLPGSFSPPSLLSTGTAQPSAIRLADLDGDGRLDLVVGARTGTALLLFFQQPSPAAPGSFAPPVVIEVGAAPVAVAAGDLTGAGRLDLVAATADGRAVVLLHDTAPGSFLPGVSYPAGLRPVAVEIADLDGDGHPDLLMADSGGALLVMTQRAGGGAFDPVLALSTFDWDSRALAVADLDGDGRLDVAVASAGPSGLPGSVAVFFQAAAPASPGTLLSPQRYTGFWGPLSIAAADLSGDALLDLVIADGLASIRYQGPLGHFQPPIWLLQ